MLTSSLIAVQTYVEFIGALIAVNTVLYIILAWTDFYVDFIGFVALGLESTVSLEHLFHPLLSLILTTRTAANTATTIKLSKKVSLWLSNDCPRWMGTRRCIQDTLFLLSRGQFLAVQGDVSSSGRTIQRTSFGIS